MNKKRSKGEKIFLFILFTVPVVFILFFLSMLATESNELETRLADDSLVTVLVTIFDDEKLINSNILLFNNEQRRSAFFAIPGSINEFIKSLDRYDRIDSVYIPNNPTPFVDEISQITDLSIPYHIQVHIDNFSEIVDLIDGISYFVQDPFESVAADNLLMLPSGAVILDGDKSKSFINFNNFSDQSFEIDEVETEKNERHQHLTAALFSGIGTKARLGNFANLVPFIYDRVNTNFSREAFSYLFERMDSGIEVLFLQTLGDYQQTEQGKTILISSRNGELLKETINRTINNLKVDLARNSEGNSVTMEILNGTQINGLAARTAEIYRSLGYEVAAIGNADTNDFEKTLLYDRINNIGQAQAVASVIKCKEVASQLFTETELAARSIQVDFTLILGKDFNGQYCE